LKAGKVKRPVLAPGRSGSGGAGREGGWG